MEGNTYLSRLPAPGRTADAASLNQASLPRRLCLYCCVVGQAARHTVHNQAGRAEKERKDMSRMTYDLRVIWTCMKKDIQSALTQRIGAILGVILPVNFLILMSLFALAGAQAPTAVVMQDRGPYARAFYDAMAHAHSFRLQTASAEVAQDLLQAGKIVAVVTIPADFDTRLRQNQRVSVAVQINNLNTDFTNDIRRAVPLSITIFYGKALPHLVLVTMNDQDLHAKDTDYIPYL